MLYDLENTNQVTGTNQTLKCLNKDKVKVLFVAKDANDEVTGHMVELAKAKNVKVEFVNTMKELGNRCNIEVKTAIAAIIV